VGRKTVPNTWPGDSEAPVAECVSLNVASVVSRC